MTRVRLQRRSVSGLWAIVGLMGCAWFAAERARADVPSLLPIQGYLTDKQGKALSGSRDLTFRLYPAATGDSPFHEETISVVVLDGHFNAYLGDDSGQPLQLSDLRDNSKVFLGIEVENDGEGSPRLQLASTAFAAQAAYCSDATNLGGKAPSEFATSAHTHSWSDILDRPFLYPPEPHMHGSADIMCYADLADEGYLDNDDPGDLLTQGQADDRFAAQNHAHDAGDIQSGTLSDQRYSCYDDLNNEGYLNNDASGDLLTQNQGDGRWVKRGENNSVSSPMLAAVRMDKTNAPIGANSTSQQIAPNTQQYIFPSPAYAMDSNGTCVVTAVARAYTTSALPVGATFYVYAAIDNGGSQLIIGNFSYAMPGTNTGYYTTSAVSGQYDVNAGTTYKFGCYVAVTNQVPFGNLAFTCMASWVCN